MVFLVLHENSHSHGTCQLRRTKSEQCIKENVLTTTNSKIEERLIAGI